MVHQLAPKMLIIEKQNIYLQYLILSKKQPELLNKINLSKVFVG